MATSAPSSARRCAMAAPMPRLPPVIRATFPRSFIRSSSIARRLGGLHQNAFEDGAQLFEAGLDLQLLPVEVFLAAPPQAAFRIFQLVTGQNGHYVRARLDLMRLHEFSQAGDGGGRRRFAAHAIASERSLSLKDLVVGHRFAK